MNHTGRTATGLLEHFLANDDLAHSIITLGGTGPNSTCQLALLELIGSERLQALKAINLLSGSAFGYFIYWAFKAGKINLDHYLNYDGAVRALHGGSFLKGLGFFCGFKLGRQSLYDNHRIEATVRFIMHEDFCARPLRSFNYNMIFWSYCSRRQSLIKITPETFPLMQLWEVISACVSIDFIHGEFIYGDYHFSDPMFSPEFKTLLRNLLGQPENHLFVNYKRSVIAGHITFIKNQPNRLPLVSLVLDFLAFICNLKNPRLIQTHRQNVEMMLGGDVHHP